MKRRAALRRVAVLAQVSIWINGSGCTQTHDDQRGQASANLLVSLVQPRVGSSLVGCADICGLLHSLGVYPGDLRQLVAFVDSYPMLFERFVRVGAPGTVVAAGGWTWHPMVVNRAGSRDILLRRCAGQGGACGVDYPVLAVERP